MPSQIRKMNPFQVPAAPVRADYSALDINEGRVLYRKVQAVYTRITPLSQQELGTINGHPGTLRTMLVRLFSATPTLADDTGHTNRWKYSNCRHSAGTLKNWQGPCFTGSSRTLHR
jgi:hypothetical protein